MSQIKLEVGKTYLNKKGEYINIVGTSPYDNGYQVFVGIDSNDETSSYYQDGEYNHGAGQCDLVSEHKEPVVQERWLVILKNAEGEEISVIHTEKQDTSRFTRLKVVNQQKITYTEAK